MLPSPLKARWRLACAVGTSAVVLMGGRATAHGPPSRLTVFGQSVRAPDEAAGWTVVEQHLTAAADLWREGDEAGALRARVDALHAAMECKSAPTEIERLVFNTYEKVFLQVTEGANLSAEQADRVHISYRRFVAEHLAPRSLAPLYEEFSRRFPPRDADADDILDADDKCPSIFGIPPDGCPEAAPSDADGDGIPDSVDRCPGISGVPPEGCPEAPAPSTLSGRGLRIGGAIGLSVGVGSLIGGAFSLGVMAVAQRNLDQCSLAPGCSDASSATYIRRGQLNEILGPTLLATGGALAVASIAMLAVGVKRKRSRLSLNPTLHPQFVGAAWALRF
jgi:hypothetical protein